MGLAGPAVATTLAGEFTLALSPGLETVSGKSEPGGGGGSIAGGAGRELVVGDQVGGMGDGLGDAPGDGEGVGEAGGGVGAGVGLAVGLGSGAPGVAVGVGRPATVVVELPPAHPIMSGGPVHRQATNHRLRRIDACEDKTFTGRSQSREESLNLRKAD